MKDHDNSLVGGEVVFHFAGKVRLGHAEEQEFEVRIFAARPSEEFTGMVACAIDCPFLRKTQDVIPGVDAEDALEMSRLFIQTMLDAQGATLLDLTGRPFRILDHPALKKI